jgi:ammonia channel protein AmtB
VYPFVVTCLILKVLDRFQPVRVSDEVALQGLDKELHGEDAYILN